MLSHSINSKYISNNLACASTLLIYFGSVQTGTKGLLETGEVYPLSFSLGLGVSCAREWIDGPSNGKRRRKERESERGQDRAGRQPGWGRKNLPPPVWSTRLGFQCHPRGRSRSIGDDEVEHWTHRLEERASSVAQGGFSALRVQKMSDMS